MKKLKIAFDARDKTERGSIFIFHGKKDEIYLRARVSNTTNENLGLARLFLTRIEFTPARGKKRVITDDTLPLNWALLSGADVTFFGGYSHQADILTFTRGEKNFKPMVTRRAPGTWPQELSEAGEYRLHLLLAGEKIAPITAVLKFQWPLKNFTSCRFSISK